MSHVMVFPQVKNYEYLNEIKSVAQYQKNKQPNQKVGRIPKHFSE